MTGEVITESGLRIGGATVYIPGGTATTTSGTATRTFDQGLVASDGTPCEDPPEEDQAVIVTCTAADGTFTLDTSQLSSNPTQVIYKGTLGIVPLTCSILRHRHLIPVDSSVASHHGRRCGSNRRTRQDGGRARGMADDDTNDNASVRPVYLPEVLFGSEYSRNMTIIDGTNSTASYENGVSYRSWDKYLQGTYPLLSNGQPIFDIIFIDSGNSFETHITGSAARTVLQNYVNAGGRLFVTDLSYDFIEQPFPYVMKFEGDPDSATTPGALNAAQDGVGGATYDVKINSTSMAVWLSSVDVTRTTIQLLEIRTDAIGTSGQVTGSSRWSSTASGRF